MLPDFLTLDSLLSVQKFLDNSDDALLYGKINWLWSELKSTFFEVLQDLTKNNFQIFPSNYSRIFFLVENYDVPEEIKQKLLFLNKLFLHYEKSNFSKIDFINLYIYLTQIISYFYKIEIPHNFPESNTTKVLQLFERYQSRSTNLITLIQIVVEETYTEENTILCNDGNKKVIIDCSTKWKEIPKIVQKGTTLNCVDLEQIDNEKFQTTNDSLIVIEPDYLYDITEVSQCFTHNGSNAYLYFIYKFFPRSNTFYSFLGNLVNHFFDELLVNPEQNFESIFLDAISKKFLAYLELKKKFPDVLSELKKELLPHYHTLRKIAINLEPYAIQIEPTFFSAIYGLAGRMDVLLESPTHPNWKTIVELKSGTPPKANLRFQLSDNSIFFVPMWHSHYAQTIGYNLLADSVTSERKGSSMILYSKDGEKPLREAINDINLKREFIKTRNWIYLLESQLAKGKFSIFNSLKELSNNNDDQRAENKLIVDILFNLEPDIKALILYYIRFIINEIRLGKVGNCINYTSKVSQSSLWNSSFDEKLEQQTAIVNLTLQPELCDFERQYLYFQRDNSLNYLCSIRKGDIVVVYNQHNIQNRFAFELFKGTIREIERDYVIVSLRNKFTSFDKFNRLDGWIIEEDYLESTNRYLFLSLFKFIQLPKDKFNYILGKVPPYKIENKSLSTSSHYDDVIKKAITYYPYFLVVGPPGTGKTRNIIFNLIEYYLRNTEDKILVCAYTNRAVDEIAQLLNQNGFQNDFIRIGTKDSSELKTNVLAYLIEDIDLEALETKIQSCRIFLGTAHSFLSNSEIFELVKFKIAIIDEASQLLFPHIAGIISEVEKFILIGDEKQLPAVVLQENFQTKVKNQFLIDLGYYDLGISYFEFLLSRAQKNGWNFAYATLNVQFRMHQSILKPINYLFYEGKIQTFPTRNTNSEIDTIVQHLANKLGFDSSERVIFFDLPLDSSRKANRFHTKIIADLIIDCYKGYSEIISTETFGVVSPFRAQNSEIYKLLPPELQKLVTIDTIERFQGSEREIIFLSLPFNNRYQIKYSSNLLVLPNNQVIDRKLNVAMSRAREFLGIFGNFHLISSSKIYSKLADYLRGHNLIVSLTNYS